VRIVRVLSSTSLTSLYTHYSATLRYCQEVWGPILDQFQNSFRVKTKENPQAYILRNHIGIRRFKQSHPKVMLERLENNPVFDPKQAPRIWNKDEIKNALTFLWESVVPYRIGEFRNYELKK
jgi:hypothetical protein